MSQASPFAAEAMAVGKLADYGAAREARKAKSVDFTPTTKFGEIWKGIHPIGRTVIALAATGIVVFGAYKGYQAYTKWAATRRSREEQKDINKDLKDLQQSGIKGTLTASQLSDMANQLDTAFQGYGSDVSTVNRVMVKLRNDVDVLNLKKTFGVRTISSGKGNPAPDKTGSLGEIMSDELSVNEINVINTVLAKQGIKNRF